MATKLGGASCLCASLRKKERVTDSISHLCCSVPSTAPGSAAEADPSAHILVVTGGQSRRRQMSQGLPQCRGNGKGDMESKGSKTYLLQLPELSQVPGKKMACNSLSQALGSASGRATVASSGQPDELGRGSRERR